MPNGQQPIVQQQRPPPGDLAAPQRAEQLVQLPIIQPPGADLLSTRSMAQALAPMHAQLNMQLRTQRPLEPLQNVTSHVVDAFMSDSSFQDVQTASETGNSAC